MVKTFNFKPCGVQDLTSLAREKGLAEVSLKNIAERFGLQMKKDPKMTRSNWACPELSQDQIQYAAEDAYFAFILLEKLQNLPDPMLTPDNKEDYSVVNQGVLELTKDMIKQGIVRKHDGLWCSMCEKGPMTVPLVVHKHMEGQKHRKKLAEKFGAETPQVGELPDEYVLNGIICGNGLNPNLRAGEFTCTLCEAGPFISLANVDTHLKSKKHQKNITPTHTKAAVAEVKDPFESKMWNMPDYVLFSEERDGPIQLTCSLCQTKATTVMMMFCHLGGEKHARKCRSTTHDEIIYVKERDRLENLSTGRPVVRQGFKMPRGESSSSKSSSKPKQEEAALSPNWERYVDATSGHTYYYNKCSKVSQWELPTEAPQVDEEVPTQQTARKEQLPPGWWVVQCKETGANYYADYETQSSQWNPPEPYVHGSWKRQVDPQGRAFWSSETESFYETDPSWQRLMDQAGCTYWSNPQKLLRFFEEMPS